MDGIDKMGEESAANWEPSLLGIWIFLIAVYTTRYVWTWLSFSLLCWRLWILTNMEKGYTSLGGRRDTLPNPRLKKQGNEQVFRPAYELIEDDEERLGRYK